MAVLTFAPILVVAGILLPALNCSASLIGTWTDPLEISSNANIGLTTHDGLVISYRPFEDGTLVASLDAGATWSNEAAHSGWIQAVEGIVYRVNMSDEEYSSGTVLFSSSSDNGETWSDTVQVFTIDSINDGAFGVDLIDGVLFVYSYDNAGSSEGAIKIAKSVDDGITWSAPATIDSNVHVEDPFPAGIVHFGGKLYFAYFTYETDPEEFYNVITLESSDMGSTWENRNIVADDGVYPQVKSDGEALYLTYWAIGGAIDTPVLRFLKSTDGTSWSAPIDVGIVDDFTDPCVLHALEVVSEEVFVAYTDYNSTDGDLRVRINYSADGGDTWEDLGDVTGSASNTYGPALSIDGTKLHFTWIDAGTEIWTEDVTTCYRSVDIGAGAIPEFGGILAPTVVLLTTFVLIARFMTRRSRR
jgi:hypothetical protein